MPSLNGVISKHGPILRVSIGISRSHMEAMVKRKEVPPMNTSGEFLVDTGASTTNIDGRIIKSLGLKPRSHCPVHTPSTGQTPSMMPEYDVSMIIRNEVPDTPSMIHEDVRAIGSDFSAQKIDGLIGRDILGDCTLIYNGPNQTFTLRY